MTLTDILKYEPQLAKLASGPEPSLHTLLTSYYTGAGFTTKESWQLAEDYIAKLEEEFIK